MTSDQAIGRLLELTGAKPDDTEQLIVVLPRPSNEEAMADLRRCAQSETPDGVS